TRAPSRNGLRERGTRSGRRARPRPGRARGSFRRPVATDRSPVRASRSPVDREARAAWRGGSALASEAAEDREGVLRHRLVDELAACLDLAVNALRQLASLLLTRGARDDEVEAPRDAVTLRLEL